METKSTQLDFQPLPTTPTSSGWFDPQPEVLSHKKLTKARQLWQDRIAPASLIPLATANGMLVIGTHISPTKDCFFALPQYLIWTGTISLALVVLGVISRYLLSMILQDAVITRCERVILAFLYTLSFGLVLVQVVLLLIGTIILIPNLSVWQYADPEMPNYCEYGMVTFALIYLSMSWVFIVLGLILATIIWTSSRQARLRLLP